MINPDGTTCYTASIDENGLLKPTERDRSVIATSTDNRGITGEKIITMHQRYEAEDAEFSEQMIMYMVAFQAPAIWKPRPILILPSARSRVL